MISRIRRRLQSKRRRRAVLFVMVLLLIWLIVRCSSDAFKPPALVYIPKGNADTVVKALHEQHIPIDPDDAADYLHGQTVKPGWVRFNPHLSIEPQSFLKRLLKPERERTRKVVMYSGDTIQHFAKMLSSQTLLPKGKLLNAYYHYSPYSDGGILAGYYDIPYKTTPEATMFHLTYLSRQKFKALSGSYGIPYDPKTFKRTLIVASIIQKETWHSEEMPRIASVIANRLKRGMRLQLDATLNYGPYAHTPVTPERIRTDASRYNTYRHAGLPPEPISSVTVAAIRAAFDPAKTDYLFFVRNAQGTHDFSNTYTEHLATIQRIKAEKALKNTSEHNSSNEPNIPQSQIPQWDSSRIPTNP